ncbi:hypothetical protein PGT21_002391 [Puccinia graminis f. sp. tritici]|uniref:Uncharacterized protein n=1 Tax=Puccinia graminis f. sp. tritici TaxID=56615 RepID=A0A5B0NNL9_PUCGR|nr:hypothetical protein PGT21_002391 [Puccinia graminis f. sp. tritici]KAA1090222.1 hypothetical protein PGTUg99_037267 [Puccinia graminis f. sp. tritici]
MSPNNRVRIRTHPPLRPFQAWVPFNPDQSIHSLKAAILNLLQLTPNNQSTINSADDILLELDAFAFLDQSLCSLIDPAHDLIDVKTLSPIPSSSQIQPSKKRRRSQAKTQTTPTEPLPSPQRSKSQPAERPIKPLQQSKLSKPTTHQPPPNLPKIHSPSTSSVNPANLQKDTPAPPGQGKPSTKARNQRKRIKRIREREKKQSTVLGINQTQAHSSQNNKLQSKPPQATTKGALNINQGAKTDSSKSSKDCSSSETSSQQDQSSSDSSSGTSSDDSSSSSSSESDSDSDSEPATSVPKSTLSEASSQPSELPSKRPNLMAPITQKKVPIVPNPHLTMLSLSNKNKRKNLKRKSGPEQLAQPSKIVFGSGPSEEASMSPVKSPCYMPPSPNLGTAPTSPILAPADLPQKDYFSYDYASFNNCNEEEEGEEQEEEFVDYSVTHAARSHGPPPSARDFDLIPSNVLITSINVLNPYWTPGQTGERWDYDQPTYTQLAYEQTVSKKTRKNRKKSLKRRRRIAAKTRLADQGQQGDAEEEEADGGSDGSEIDEEIRKDVEDAYAEFIGSGGHSSHQQDDPNLRPDGLLESLNQTWDQLEKVDRKSAVLGSKVAIRTIELSVESFTPETMTYYGTLVGTNESTLALKLDRGCIPTGQGMMETSGYDQTDEAAMDDDQGGGQESDEEERMVDVKEAIRAHQRNALALDVWGGSSDVRDWEWNTIIDARKL